MMYTTDVNYISIVVSAVIYFVLGACWYSDKCCGRIWIEEVKMRAEEMGNKTVSYVGTFVLALVMSYVLLLFIKALGVTTAFDGACIGFWAWLGFVTTTQVSGVLWGHKTFKIYVVHIIFLLIALTLMGAVLAAWQ